MLFRSVAYELVDEDFAIFVVVKELVRSGRQLCRDVQLNISSTFMHEVSESNEVYAVHAKSVKGKCVMIKSKDKTYAILLPNNVERD